ncbi:MAG TPA: beta-hexosaminidase [Ruminococcaceae bacterium]|nr:beta-hexosaminidase [Oscillospiraceae bacterium]
MKNNIKLSLFLIILFSLIFAGGCNFSEESTPLTKSEINSQQSISEGGFLSEPESVVSSIPVTEPAVTTEEQTTVPDPLDEKALRFLSRMSLEEKIGQVILCRYADNAGELQGKYHFGGYTLYAKDFQNETENSIKEKKTVLSELSLIAPFIAADEEGGSVVRISKFSQFSESPLPPLKEGAKNISEFAAKMADILKKGGVNLNLAPVADTAENEYDYIYDRTCGLGWEETGDVISELVSELKGRGIMCCLKHFPGYGSNVDTHTGIAVDNRTENDFITKDFIPFKKGIEAGAPMVMVNHNIVTAYNGTVPASLAPEVHKALRELGFDGIIVTDDLGMGAIAEYSKDPYADAFLAGNDLLCTSDGIACYNALMKGITSGKISKNRLDESVFRILRAKISYGIQ